MDLIYKAKPPNVSEKFNIKDTMSQFSQKVKEFEEKMLELKLKNVASGKSLSYDDFADSFCCHLENLDLQIYDVEALKAKSGNFDKPDFPREVLRGLGLNSIEHARRRAILEHMHQVRRHEPNAYGTIELPNLTPLRYRGMRYLEDGRDKERLPTDPPDLIPNVDFTCLVRSYHPFKHVKCTELWEKPKISQDIIAHGRNTLEQLRSMIICNKDMGAGQEMSDNPQERVSLRTYDIYKSGFIFIDNTFYNATRNSTCIDYSAVIREWAASRNIGPFKTATLERTRLQDLNVQLGYPYVYQHQGDCEHLIVFSSVQLVANDDPLVVRNYPFVRGIPKYQSKICYVCRSYNARWVTEGSNRLPVDPCFFCETCFMSFHYIDGKKVGEFKAFPYFHQTSLI